MIKVFAAALLALLAPACASVRTSPSSLPREYVSRAARFGFSGAILAVSHEHVVLEAAGGFANVTTREPNTPATLFNIGSLAKQFTAAAILKLEEDRRLSTSDRVSRFFPAITTPVGALTIEQLLTHSSGLPWDVESGGALSREQFLKLASAAKLAFTPGARFSYSNVGYGLLAAIVEEASGIEFETFLEQRLFAPAGLVATGYLTSDAPSHRAAHGYLAGEDRGFPWEGDRLADRKPAWPRGAGEIVSHVEDLDRWASALLGQKVLSAASLAKLFACHVATGEGDGECYGYGWNVETEGGRRVVWHDGSNGPFWARLTLYPDESLRVVTLSNKALLGGWLVNAAVRHALTGDRRPVLPPRAAPLHAEDFALLKGTYELASGATIEIIEESGALLVRPIDERGLAILDPVRAADADRAASLTRIAGEVLDAASRGDFEPLRRAAANDAAFDDTREHLEYFRALGARAGGFERFGVIGTGPGPSGPAMPLATFAYAQFGKGKAPLRLVWKDDTIAESIIQSAAFVSPPRFELQRDGAGFIAYSLAIERKIGIRRGGYGEITLVVDGRAINGKRK